MQHMKLYFLLITNIPGYLKIRHIQTRALDNHCCVLAFSHRDMKRWVWNTGLAAVEYAHHSLSRSLLHALLSLLQIPDSQRNSQAAQQQQQQQMQDSALGTDRLTSLHAKLHNEADKIRKWKTQTEMDLKHKVET